MKLNFRAACLAACFGLAGAGTAGAADQQPHSGRVDLVAVTQKNLEHLGKNLYLKPEQQDAWSTYVAAMTQLARERSQEMAGGKQGWRKGSENISTPDRLDRMIERMRQGADRLAKVASETRTFYTRLSPEQKTIFDLQARDAWRKQRGRHMHPGVPR
ncbi:MAG: Spy/CpxP family protein refolding chaperone [Betaproteobacteria bacterium]|nr:Spy/CpxP family protein refolding chaperone [Betaproteobacteria bacterium]